ncbi:hypothetical protein QE152_g29930 [Popillia japonica]|uniref:Craniofacial development protein 2-like n=1 Tax=Popillia japonica TaxID=7064 RepID=A0AAW1JFS6_POPJA
MVDYSVVKCLYNSNSKYNISVIDFEERLDRICRLRIRGETKNISFLNIDAPTEEKEEETKDIFYEELEMAIDNIPKEDILIVIGDANAKIGSEKIYGEITGEITPQQGQRNKNGLRLIDLAIESDMKIMSTHFERKDVHTQRHLDNTREKHRA